MSKYSVVKFCEDFHGFRLGNIYNNQNIKNKCYTMIKAREFGNISCSLCLSSVDLNVNCDLFMSKYQDWNSIKKRTYNCKFLKNMVGNDRKLKQPERRYISLLFIVVVWYFYVSERNFLLPFFLLIFIIIIIILL